MLFNSYTFILFFLPITLLIFYSLGRLKNKNWALFHLTAASLFFYGWWNPKYVGLMAASILFNYFSGIAIAQTRRKKAVLTGAVTVNLLLLAYYKYANFFIDNLNSITGTRLILEDIVLPLGISFFTFTQIAFLVDTYKGKVREFDILRYSLFVTYFPHLIAGPIIHHKEMMTQFAKDSVRRIDYVHLAPAITLFFAGLCKKVFLADPVSVYASRIFEAAASGMVLTLFESWLGSLAYTFQLYFDFSGYSDMALGLALLFNTRFPINFFSPYKATSIIDFWRRWHMTLSRFLKEYIYIPLGGNRLGARRRHVNIMITMLLGGIWHGAGWTFVIWGALHGFYLLVNHSWRAFRGPPSASKNTSRVSAIAARALTFLCVVVAWVFFRAQDVPSALIILRGMFGAGGISFPEGLKIKMTSLSAIGVHFDGLLPAISDINPIEPIRWILFLAFISFFMPNLIQWMSGNNISLDAEPLHLEEPRFPFWNILKWRPTIAHACVAVTLIVFGILTLGNVSEFLYFEF